MAEVVKTRFLREFQRNLFPQNDFWRNSRQDSGADDNAAIEIPVAASKVGSTFGPVQAGQVDGANAASLAAKVRLNNKKSYAVQVFGTEPTALQLIDLDTISYDKRQELYAEHQEVINTEIANYAAIQFAAETGGNILVTTGTARANQVTGGGGGNVKRIVKADIVNVSKTFMRMNISGIPGGLFALITPEQWEDLLLIPEFVDYEKTGRESLLREGKVGRLMGITFLLPRHNPALNANVVYTAGTTKLAYGAAVTGNERSAAVFWHSGLVRTAPGRGKLYFDKDNPLYKADIMSADARFGATQSRADNVGVVSLVEDTTV